MPGEIQIGAVRYVVRCDEDTAKELQLRNQEHHEPLLGHSDTSDQLILVNLGQGTNQRAVTLLHEVMHCVWFATGLGETPAKEYEELVIAAMDDALVDALRRNPELVRFVCGEA